MTTFEEYGILIDSLCARAYNENYVVRMQLCEIYDDWYGISGISDIRHTHKLVTSLYFFALRHTGYNGVSNDLFDKLESVYMYGKLVCEY